MHVFGASCSRQRQPRTSSSRGFVPTTKLPLPSRSKATRHNNDVFAPLVWLLHTTTVPSRSIAAIYALLNQSSCLLSGLPTSVRGETMTQQGPPPYAMPPGPPYQQQQQQQHPQYPNTAPDGPLNWTGPAPTQPHYPQQAPPPVPPFQSTPIVPESSSALSVPPPPNTPPPPVKRRVKGRPHRLEESVLVTRSADEETPDGRVRNREAVSKIRDTWIYKQIRERQDEFTNYKKVSDDRRCLVARC
jgi:hypothetical protein